MMFFFSDSFEDLPFAFAVLWSYYNMSRHESFFICIEHSYFFFPGIFSDIFLYHISCPFSLFFIFWNTNKLFVKPSYSVLHLLVLLAGIPGISVILGYPMLTLWLGKERFLNSLYCRGQCKFGPILRLAQVWGSGFF